MLKNKRLFSLLLFICTLFSVVPALLTLLFDLQWFQWGILLIALFITLPLYLFRLSTSSSKVSYVAYSALSSIAIIYIVSISYTLMFNDFKFRFQETPNLLALTIVPFYFFMCFKYRTLNKINSKVGKCIVAVIGAATTALVGIFVIAADAAVEESEDNKPTIDDSPDGHIGWNGGYKYSDNFDEN